MLLDDYLSKDELRYFTERSDLMGAWMLVGNWALIAAIFALAARWPNPLVLLLAVLLLGGRQLGLAVLMHEAGHGTLFRSPWMNRVLGQWLAALPVLGDCPAYAASHREHHRRAGTAEDPDLPNYRAYPISVASARRKLWRDISGQTGLRMLLGRLRGSGNRLMMRDGERAGPLVQGLAANAALLLILALCGVPELYLLWVIAYLTSYPLLARLRQVAEHGAVEDLYDPDPRRNTRTVRAAWFERLLLCPNHVNFHLEHHLLASVPAHRLGELHELLRERGFYGEFPQAIADSYLQVMRRAVAALAHDSAATS